MCILATLPDMWERTLTIGSAGKTFSVTGWKVSFMWYITWVPFWHNFKTKKLTAFNSSEFGG